MKARHVEGQRANARAILSLINSRVGQNFFTLSASQVCALLEHADLEHYRKPKNANGSRGRYYYALLQRRANAKVKD